MPPKTFGLVQRGNGRFGNHRGRGGSSGGLHGSVTYRSAPGKQTPEVTETDKKLEIEARNELDLTMGFGEYAEGPEKLGWLVNIHPTTVYVDSDSPGKSGLDMYFYEEDGSTFKATILFEPYFYIICKPGTEADVEDYLKRRFTTTILSTKRVEMEDLQLGNHLVGMKRILIKLTFINMNDLLSVRRIIQPVAERNKKKQDTTGAFDEIQQIAMASNSKVPKSSAKSHEVLDNILELREYDVQYYIRVAIDCDLRVGLWYNVKAIQGQITIKGRPDLVSRADPVVLAFDIETTKLPLKFPDAAFDSIMMISYMVDGQGYLITNREIVSEDIDDFDYTPKPEFEGPFVIFNEENEISLLRRFFEHFREVKASIVVTYNGDFFDFPFIEARAVVHGLDMKKEIGFYKNLSGEYCAYNAMHMDCFCWVKRDSYLPQGSQGLKAVTTAKLGYNPMELDPEDMTGFATEQPQTLAQYSVSDAVATYYLYMKYVHPFIFSLCNIIPMNPDDVLRRGSGTLCEHLLMVQAFKANVIMPNKHQDDSSKFFQGHLLESETYVGGHVEALEAGVFRSDIPVKFRLVPDALQQLIDEVDQALKFCIQVEAKANLDDITNYDEVKKDVIAALTSLRDTPNRIERPLIYHLDVAAMYPNIILTNRLQPDAVIDEGVCASCDFNEGPNSICQRRMDWSWRGEYFPAKRSEYNMIRNQLEQEKFPTNKFGKDQLRSFHELSVSEKNTLIKKRLSDYSRKVYNRIHETAVIQKEAIICQRENPFYINTVRDFRDRRYEYKGLHKVWKKKLEEAANDGNSTAQDEAKRLVVVYDSLQLAHKCILNSFYGYVMRKGARWYNMEMAGVVCLTGARIIQLARSRVEQIGRPLELDTDGIWCILPATFPENFAFKLKSGKSIPISYPGVMLNHLVHDQFTNHQYQELENPASQTYSVRSENSIFFEVDGPYKAMILPSSTEEDKLLKKRYAVFNDDGTLAELKGFEIKRRGELKLIKIFQSEIFKCFLQGDTLEKCYGAVAVVANRWLDFLFSKGMEHTDEEVFDLISENRSMSKSLEEYGAQKSTSISTARRLAEFLGDQMVKDKGLNCKFIISTKPLDAPVSERAIPVVIFQADPSIRKHFLRKWLKDISLQSFDIRDIVDWKYYMDRFGSVVQKIITIPAAMQGISNPVPRIRHPDWLFKRVAAMDDRIKQVRITDMFSVAPAQSQESSTLDSLGLDLEDIGSSKPVVYEVKETTLGPHQSSKKPKGQPDVHTQYHEWIAYQKIKWRNRRLERLKEREKYGKDFDTRRRAVNSQGMSGFLHRQQDNILRYKWQVLQIVETDTPGEFRVWALIQDSLYSIKLTIPRVFYVNSKVYNSNFEDESHPYQVLRATKSLPRSQPTHHLYEFTMTESFFLENAGRFSQLFNHENIEGVYELQVPLLIRALIRLGSTVSVRPKVAQHKVLDASFELDDLKHETKGKEDYLSNGATINYLFLYHSSSENGNRQIFGLFSHQLNTLWVHIVDPGQNRDAVPNIKRLYNEKFEERGVSQLTQTTQLVTMPDFVEYPEKMDVRLTLHTGEKEALAALNRAFREYQDQRRGSTVVALQSAHSQRYLQMQGLSISQDFPILSVPFHVKDNAFPAISWQSYSLPRMMDHFFNLNDFLKDRISLARYGDVPLCNIHHDFTMFFCDLFLSRRLHRADMVSWYSPSEKPDLGGRELDDNKHDLEELVNPEINIAGHYGTVCVEIDVWDLALNTIMQSNVFNEFESAVGAVTDTRSHLLDFHLKQNTDTTDTGAFNIATAINSSDESRINAVTFGIIKNMIRSWSEEVAKRNRIGSTMLEHLYRWITSASSGMYDPAINSLVHDLMKRAFIHLIADLRNSGCQIVFATFHKIVLATSKTSIPNAISYVTYLLQTIRKKELFAHIDLKPIQVWDHLIWMDAFNYGGILCENLENAIDKENIDDAGSGNPKEKTTVDFRWNMAEYLPPACKKQFIKLIAGFIFELHYYKNQQKGSGKPGATNVGLPSAKVQEELSNFLKHLIGSTIKRRLFTVVRQLQKQEVDEDDEEEYPYEFPTLPGSHLVMKNPVLEFIKLVSQFFSLDGSISREARLVRKDLLNLIGVREFSLESNYVNPCEAFSLPQVICDFCNHCQDLDLTRAEELDLDGEETQEARKSWSCSVCHTLYDKVAIEQRLINIVRKRLLTWQLQDLKCERCKMVRAEEIRENCQDCSGKLVTELTREDFSRRMKVFVNIGQFYGMESLMDVMDWVQTSL